MASALRQRVYLCFRNRFMAIAKYFELSPLPSCWSQGALLCLRAVLGVLVVLEKNILGRQTDWPWRAGIVRRLQSCQRSRGSCITLRSGEAKPSDGLSSVLRNTLTALKHDGQVELSFFKPLCRCKAVESHSLRMVLRNSSTVVKTGAQVALS